MPSPAGHLLAGVTIAWAAEALQPRRARVEGSGALLGPAPAVTPLVLVCAALALAPDLDILLASHRTYTHSLAAVALAATVCAAVARARGAPGFATGVTCGVAVASHIVLDLLGRDSSAPAGLMALWPFSAAYWYPGIDLFAEISRRYWKPEEFIVSNAISVARELLILGPLAALAWWVRQRRHRSG